MPDIVIQRILRHANFSTTASYFIKSASDDVRNAMARLEKQIAAIIEKNRSWRECEAIYRMHPYPRFSSWWGRQALFCEHCGGESRYHICNYAESVIGAKLYFRQNHLILAEGVMKAAEYVIKVLSNKEEPEPFIEVVRIVMKDVPDNEDMIKAAIWRLNSEGLIEVMSDLKLRLPGSGQHHVAAPALATK